MYIRKLNDNERSVLSHLVELCCEAYWREAEICRIHFDHGELFFTAKIDSNWDLIEREELSLEDYNQIVETLEGIFEPSKTGSANVENRIVTVTLNSEVGRPLMNLYFDFAGKEREPS
ncbi:MAG: hypothetical protein JNN15_08275, partial [Blastocatellia bacterium]|nr:hypothetical protein [Blastocatellia bacterium]